jgi:heme/copper-type cytochrome/quinol oxidase subunit 3
VGGSVNGPASPAAGASSIRRLEPARVGLMLFIAMEIMFFAGLISSFAVFRFSPVSWPPADQPRMPIPITGLNTLVLLVSGLTFFLALSALKSSDLRLFKKLLTWTVVLGVVFLGVQGMEWVKLLHFGLTAHSSIFGGFFYCLVGTHAVHVLGGLIALLYVWRKALGGRYDAQRTLGVELCRTYWFFVVALWPILFVLVYL